jgi:hypothetical protein
VKISELPAGLASNTTSRPSGDHLADPGMGPPNRVSASAWSPVMSAQYRHGLRHVGDQPLNRARMTLMRVLILTVALVLATVTPAAAQMTDLERQRLVAHLEMTASWLEDELSNLSPAQVEFRRAPGTWNILEVLEHLVVVGPIYWNDLRQGVEGPPTSENVSSGDATILWYGIDRTNREPAVPPETARGELRDVATGLAQYRKDHARLLDYIKTTKDDLRHRIVQRQLCDAYQWALLISTHEQRHILQIREVKAAQGYPKP